MSEYNQVMETEDFLAHYGVKGMKWGKHKAKASATDIRAARRNVQKEALKYHDQRDKVKTFDKGTKERATAEKKLGKMKADWLNNPDRVTAAKLTRGEKFAALVVLSPAGGAGFIAGAKATEVGIRRGQARRAAKK